MLRVGTGAYITCKFISSCIYTAYAVSCLDIFFGMCIAILLDLRFPVVDCEF